MKKVSYVAFEFQIVAFVVASPVVLVRLLWELKMKGHMVILMTRDKMELRHNLANHSNLCLKFYNFLYPEGWDLLLKFRLL